ncbi:MAG: universal stress protein [Desulfohalobiaceae bacterium]|nr:universal stress protein [Desulfohalobiaceae bacterium]MCF8085332.1 universal stress protein [Desulfohalobiaceae bacterium]
MKIMVAYNSRSKASENALNLAKQHAVAFGASLHVVTSAERTRSEKDIPNVEEAENGLWDVEHRLSREGITCRTHLLIQYKSRGEDLVDFAEENEIDEIVIGVEKKSRVGKFVMGSLAQYVILQAPCPVVTVKSEESKADIYLGSRSFM